MNMFKKNGGFTLVELIVVIAILAILAGVAVPAYSGYIAKAEDAKTLTSLDAIKTAVFAANATSTTKIESIEVEATTVTINGGDAADGSENMTTAIADFFDMTTLTLAGTYAQGAKWTQADGWQAN